MELGRWGKQGGAAGCWEGETEETTELEKGDKPVRAFPRDSPAFPVLSPYRGSVTLQSHSSPSGSGWASPAHGRHSGAAPTPHPTPSRLQGCRIGGCPRRKHLTAWGIPPPRAGRCPPHPGWAPGAAAQSALFLFREELYWKRNKSRGKL